MNLPEQGISGPFRITTIKHILPQKRPEDEDAGQGFVFRPVTGIFIHQSNDVWTLEFDSGDTLGVTASHPIYSTTAQDWRLAGELAIGEQVLTHAGSATLTGKRPAPVQRVYNLEVQEVHNFLVAEVGFVVHNSCWDEAAKYASGERSKSEIWELKDHPQIFKRGNIIEKVMRKGKYSSSKGWGFTGKGDGGLGYDNYWLIDFHKGNKVVSLKSTKLTNGTDWANSNAEHIKKLNQQKKLGEFPNCKPGPNCQNPSHSINNIEKAELHIVVEDVSQINQAEWLNSIRSKLPAGDEGNIIITISEL